MIAGAAAFETLARFAFVGDKAVETRAQKCLKACFTRVVVGEVVLLERVRKDTLRKILSVFVVRLPLEPDILVYRFPVAREDRVEGALSHDLIRAAPPH